MDIMSIQSFILCPQKDKFEELVSEFKATPFCEVEYTLDKSTLILITDSPSIKEDQEIELKLKNHPNISTYSLVCGFEADLFNE